VITRDTVDQLLEPIYEWLLRGGDAWQAGDRYWLIRRSLMDEGASFEGPGWNFLSDIDVAIDSYSPGDGRTPYQIDEAQLRREVTLAIEGLRSLGLAGSSEVD